jgi:hypothetical protein
MAVWTIITADSGGLTSTLPSASVTIFSDISEYVLEDNSGFSSEKSVVQIFSTTLGSAGD